MAEDMMPESMPEPDEGLPFLLIDRHHPLLRIRPVSGAAVDVRLTVPPAAAFSAAKPGRWSHAEVQEDWDDGSKERAQQRWGRVSRQASSKIAVAASSVPTI